MVQAAADAVTLSPGQTVIIAVKPRVFRPVQLDLPAGALVELQARLPEAGVRGNYVKLQPEPAAGPAAADPIISDSGLDFVQYATRTGSAQKITVQLTVLTNSKADTAELSVYLSLAGLPDSSPRQDHMHAATAFIHAERLRRTRAGGAAALAVYQQALEAAERSGDRVLQQQILLSAGRMLMTDGRHYAEAIDWERRAVAVTGTDAAPSVQALAWKMLGGALLNTAQYPESLAASSRALALYQKTGERFWQGVVLENMGEAQLNLGDLPQALATDERALAISRELHDDFGVVEMLTEIGSIHRSRGEYQLALNDFSEAVEVTLPSDYNPMQGEAWLAMGELHRELAEPARAAEDFDRSLTIAQHTSSGLDELESIRDIADLRLLQGNSASANEMFQRGLQRAQELKLVRLQSSMLLGLGRCASAMSHAAEARSLLRQAITAAQTSGQRAEKADAYEALGRLAEIEQHRPEALADFTQAAALYASIPDKAGLAQANASLARVETASGSFAAALSHLNEAMDLIEGSRTSFARGGLRTRYFAAQRATYDQAITLLMEEDRKRPDAGFAEQAWRVAERARSRSLLDELFNANATTPEAAAHPELRQRLAALEVRLSSLDQQEAAAEDASAIARIQDELRKAVLEADELESRLRGEEYAAAPLRDMSAARLANAALGPGDLLLEYWTSPTASYLWLIDPVGRCSGFRLPAESALRERIESYRSALLARNAAPAAETLRQRDLRLGRADAQARQFAALIGATLIPPGASQQMRAARRLLVVTDGSLAQVPFAALRWHDSGARKPYLVESFELVREPSAAYLMLAPRSLPASRAFSTPRVAVFADPVYNLADARLAAVRVRSSAGEPADLRQRSPQPDSLARLPRLAGSREEADRILRLAGPDHGRLFSGFAATPAAFQTLDGAQFDIVHFAVHALAQNGRRDSTGLVLSMFDREGVRQNGVLWLRDVYAEHMARDLVVLSGCETAIGEAVPGEGLNSLAQAFLFSGTLQVAATLWPADDTSSSSLMGDFYTAMFQRGADAAAALRQAQLQLMRRPRYAAPVYWAGVTVEGRWKAH